MSHPSAADTDAMCLLAEIWAALKVAAESDIETARTIVESAGIIVSGRDLSRCWDERGALYNLPNYVLSSPTNLVKAEW